MCPEDSKMATQSECEFQPQFKCQVIFLHCTLVPPLPPSHTLWFCRSIFPLTFSGMLIFFFLKPFVITFYSCWSEHIHFHQAVWWLKHFNPEFNPTIVHIHLRVPPSLWRTLEIQGEKGRRRYSCLSSLDFRYLGYCSKGHSCWKAQSVHVTPIH